MMQITASWHGCGKAEAGGHAVWLSPISHRPSIATIACAYPSPAGGAKRSTPTPLIMVGPTSGMMAWSRHQDGHHPRAQPDVAASWGDFSGSGNCMTRISEGTHVRLGSTWDGRGTNFALFSAHAEKVELCLFDSQGRREIERIALPEHTENVWHGYLNDVAPGQLYGYRVMAPTILSAAIGLILTSCCSILMRGGLAGDWSGAMHISPIAPEVRVRIYPSTDATMPAPCLKPPSSTRPSTGEA